MQHLVKILVSSLVTIGLMTLTGCTNTVRGAGEDIQNMENSLSSNKTKHVHHKKMHKSTTTTTTTNANGSTTTTKPADSTTTTTTTQTTSQPTSSQ